MYINSRSGIIIMKTEALYEEVRSLLYQNAEYCYLIYENNQFKRLTDVVHGAVQYENDLTKARLEEQEAKKKFEAPNDGSIY